MKNIVSFSNNVRCYSCGKNGFFAYTPDGADFHSCPLCENKNWYEPDKSSLDDFDYYYCEHCRIIFNTGCKHAANGCTSDCYNGHLIGKWEYKGITYVGMPQFDSVDEFLNELPYINILEWICPNNGWHCDGGYYPKSKYPQYYKNCYLSEKQ